MKQFEGGTCRIANEVVDLLIASAAARVDGVEEVYGLDPQTNRLRHGYDRFLSTSTEEGVLETSLTIRIALGESICDVIEQVQVAVRREVTSMLGLECRDVSVCVV